MNIMIRLVLLSMIALVVLGGSRGTANAQLMVGSDTRCQGATLVSPTQALARYGWASFCRTNPPAGEAGTRWLTDASVVDHDTAANADIRDRLYPVYLDFALGGIWNAPDAGGTNCLLLPAQAVNAGLCVSGCYVEGTPLQFADGPIGIKVALDHGKADLVTLAPTATLDNLDYVTNKVARYSKDLVEEWQEIYSLSTKSGGALRVTSEHPLLTSDGTIRQAKSLQVGDNLVRADGVFDPIVGIEINNVFTKVYNVKPVTTDYTSNIVIAGGYLNGSQRYQNEFLDMINSMILRRTLGAQVDLLVER
jgi:hypothetical protein